MMSKKRRFFAILCLGILLCGCASNTNDVNKDEDVIEDVTSSETDDTTVNNDETKPENEVTSQDFIIGILWDDTLDEDDAGKPPLVVIEHSTFTADLTSEEINILALLMLCAWV